MNPLQRIAWAIALPFYVVLAIVLLAGYLIAAIAADVRGWWHRRRAVR